ncbi:hypothetical protein WH47_00388 [Habropoda laboriosa]|uniref:Uncharacterized protein n=1 Tax=Habropoda laboriosa TaxID=597456 RepID=A0A0L7R743_9HYME|nr:PREDICTED: uncharacterized protein LOC108571095 [Habropoda laboriosa]KOC66695.1 hypothetical protein WH47_00388 [Habropoda laboriosa]
MNCLVNTSRLVTVFFALLIVQVTTTLSTFIESNRFNRIQNIPPQWRVVPPVYQPPKIELNLIKSHVFKNDKNWSGNIQYILSSNDKQEEDRNIGKEQGGKGETVKNGKTTPHFGPRKIINLPWLECPYGQKRDFRGQCRDIVEIH